ncbi:MAG TPA: hypothetical protein VG841_03185 [Caulobacterales bacterium]|nr:hypothetical protein [Caulobacterales bacterium]
MSTRLAGPLLAAAAILAAAFAPRQDSRAAFTVSAPSAVVRQGDINSTYISYLDESRRYIDAPVTTFVRGGKRYWINSNAFETALYAGSLERPFQRLLWSRPTSEVISDPGRAGGAYWITNLYQADNGILAFVHTEFPRVEGRRYKSGRGRVGLAWSPDGERFTYLGHIIRPFDDPSPRNVQGVPYLIKDGFFYIYYKDACEGGNNAAARAPVRDVLAAAAARRITAWRKYFRGAWASPGAGGPCTAIRIADGIIHTDAARSTATGQYYFITSRTNANGQDTWIKLHASSDGVTWRELGVIAREPASRVRGGYQYVSIVDASGRDNASVGRQFYVYSAKDITAPAVAIYRWTVDLGPDRSLRRVGARDAGTALR